MTLSTIISAFLSGVLGSMGLGGGTVLIIYLTYFRDVPQTKAQGINLVCFIPIAIIAVFIYSKQKLTDVKASLPLIICACFGAAAGFLALNYIPDQLLGKLFGVFLILLSLKELFTGKHKKEGN